MDLREALHSPEGLWWLELLSAVLPPRLGSALPPGPAWRVSPMAVFRSPDRHRMALSGRVQPMTPEEQRASTAQFPDPSAIEVDGYRILGDKWYALTEDGREFPVEDPPARLVWSLPPEVISAFLPILEEPLTLDERALLWDLLADVIEGNPPEHPPSFPPPEDGDPDVTPLIAAALRALPRATTPEHRIWATLRRPWVSPDARQAFSGKRYRRLLQVAAADLDRDVRVWLRGQQSQAAIQFSDEGDVDLSLPTNFAKIIGFQGSVRAKTTQGTIRAAEIPDFLIRVATVQDPHWYPLIREITAALSPEPEPRRAALTQITPDQRANIDQILALLRDETRLRGFHLGAAYVLPDRRVYASLAGPADQPDVGFVLPTIGRIIPAPADYRVDPAWVPLDLSQAVPPQPTAEGFSHWRGALTHLPTRASPQVDSTGVERLLVDPRAPGIRRISSSSTWWKPGLEAALQILQRNPVALDIGFTNPITLGCGSFGCAYELPDYPGWILKITGDERDALAWAALQGSPPTDLPRVPRIWAFPRSLPGIDLPTYLYGYVQERALPLGELDRYFLGAAFAYDPASITKLRPDAMGWAETLVNRLSLDPAISRAFLLRVRLLYSTLAELERRGVASRDIRVENIGMSSSGANYWIYDLGLSDPEAADLPVIGTEIPLGDFSGWLASGIHPNGRPTRIQTLPTQAVQPIAGPILESYPDGIHIRMGGTGLLADRLPSPIGRTLADACRAGGCADPTRTNQGWRIDARGALLLRQIGLELNVPVVLTPEAEEAIHGIQPPDPCNGPACTRET